MDDTPPASAPTGGRARGGGRGGGVVRRWTCDPCRTDKVRCDGARPECGRCVRRAEHGLAAANSCRYPPPRATASLRAKATEPAELQPPTAAVALVSRRSAATTALVLTGGAAAAAAAAATAGSSLELSLVDSTAALALLSRAAISTDAFADVRGLFARSFQPTLVPTADLGLAPIIQALGPLTANEARLTAAFFDSEWLLVPFVTFIHRSSYLDRIQDALPALRWTICAAGAHLSDSACGSYFVKAKHLVFSAVDDPSLEALQAALLLSILADAISEKQLSWQLLGIACRMCIYLRLDVDPQQFHSGFASSGNWIVNETRRRVWWTCYLLDRGLSIMGEYPALLDRNLDSVRAPCKDDAWAAADERSAIEPDPDGIVRPLSQLIELAVDVFATVRDGLRSGGAGFLEQERAEEKLAAALDDHCHLLPRPLRLSVDTRRDMVAAHDAMRTRPRQFADAATLFVMQHGLRCVLLQRRCVLHLRSAVRAARKAPVAETPPGAAHHLQVAARAFARCRESARVVGKLTGVLVFSGTDLRRVVRFRPWYVLHAAAAAVLTREVAALGGAIGPPVHPPVRRIAGAAADADEGVDGLLYYSSRGGE
ncbi:hypothetical protein HK405_010699, partial [Cladochytrium tenue]